MLNLYSATAVTACAVVFISQNISVAASMAVTVYVQLLLLLYLLPKIPQFAFKLPQWRTYKLLQIHHSASII